MTKFTLPHLLTLQILAIISCGVFLCPDAIKNKARYKAFHDRKLPGVTDSGFSSQETVASSSNGFWLAMALHPRMVTERSVRGIALCFLLWTTSRAAWLNYQDLARRFV